LTIHFLKVTSHGLVLEFRHKCLAQFWCLYENIYFFSFLMKIFNFTSFLKLVLNRISIFVTCIDLPYLIILLSWKFCNVHKVDQYKVPFPSFNSHWLLPFIYKVLERICRDFFPSKGDFSLNNWHLAVTLHTKCAEIMPVNRFYINNSLNLSLSNCYDQFSRTGVRFWGRKQQGGLVIYQSCSVDCLRKIIQGDKKWLFHN